MSNPSPPRTTRVAAYLAILYGAFGALSGVIGAATFLPFRSLDGLSLASAWTLTGISIVGALASGAGAVAGWALRRGYSWAPAATVGTAAASIASVGALVLAWPPSAPFLGVVAFFYAIELILLFVGTVSVRRHAPRGAVG